MTRRFRSRSASARETLLAWLAAGLLAPACSSNEAALPGNTAGSPSGGTPAQGGSFSGGSSGLSGGSGATAGKASSGGGGGSAAQGTGGVSGGGSGTGGSGPSSTGGSAPISTGGVSASTGGTAANTGGSSGTTAGATGGGSTGGASTGGASAGGGAGGAGVAGGGASSSEPDIPCPQGATFCSGFEGTALPAGTKFHAVGPSDAATYAFDTTEPKSGRQSLAIPEHSGGFYYRALTVPVPSARFWVRLYVRVSRAFGDGGHDSLFGASNGNLAADVNGEALVEFSEQFDEVLLNTDDRLFNPEGASTLSANVWHCIEAHYDGTNGNVEIFADGKEIINAPGYATQTYQTFRLGYMQYHDTRGVWYDDVVVAPERVNCE